MTNSAVLPRLLRALRRCDQGHFYLFFIRCNSTAYRQILIDEIKTKFNQPIAEISIKTLQQEYDLNNILLDEALQQVLENYPPDIPIFIYDLEVLLPNPDKPQDVTETTAFKTLQQLNWRRSAYQRLNRGVFFWLPEYALQLLATTALDFFDWRSAIYEFDIPETEKNAYLQEELKAFRESAVHAAERMSTAEKQRWLKVLFSLRDESTPNSAELARILDDIGRVYHSLGNLELALTNYQQSLAIQQEIGDKSGEGTTLNNMATIAHARGDYETALRYLQQSLAIQQEIGDKSGEGTTLNNMATIAHARGDYETALRYLQQSLAIFKELGDKKSEGTTLNNISQIFQARGDYETALRYLQQSLAIQQEIGDKRGEGSTLNNISLIYSARGDYETALRYLQQSLAIQQEIGDKSGEGATLNNMATTAYARGDYETALRYLQQSLAIQQEIGDVAGLCATLFNMGRIHLQNEEVQEGITKFVEAYRIAHKIGYAQVLQALEELAKDWGQDGLNYWARLSQQISEP
ncbi:hypothetical protein BegalDRAFT_1396 [Beggiatoa alba B18LD]|uniref:Uncharacterized protein n=1 Tax=Beggiatoa alba B18LD TaxID=395493 RepID=I3CF97_9GAMM|nr:tetratricopeptide repeat protein [Beggiatoa alba]EIJ42290.1 hypothetical protein BegalDRAFT_1396 [Beggiatoa alba B18LD]